MNNDLDIFSGTGVVEANEIHKIAKKEVENKLPWVEKYRPKLIEDVILPQRIKNIVNFGLKNNEFSHLVFHSGKPGTGKTTLAKAIPEQLNTDYQFFSISRKSTDIIDSIQSFASQKIIDGKPRFVILDEADVPSDPNPARFYNALQPLIENTTSTLRFILTCNNLYKLPEPILSRCTPISFAYDQNDKQIKIDLFKRINYIATTEVTTKGGTVDQNTIKAIAKHYYPDIRAIIQNMYVNYLENNGSIQGEPSVVSYNHIETIWDHVNNDTFMELRKYVTEHIVDYTSLYAPFGNYVMEKIDKKHRLNFAVMLGQYQTQSAMPAVDQEINLSSFMAKLMMLLQSGK